MKSASYLPLYLHSAGLQSNSSKHCPPTYIYIHKVNLYIIIINTLLRKLLPQTYSIIHAPETNQLIVSSIVLFVPLAKHTAGICCSPAAVS